MMSSNNYDVYFILGPPGAGKGTVCTELVNSLKCAHLSAGDLLRAEKNKGGSQIAAEIERHMLAGSIVPVKITCALLYQAMVEARQDRGTTKFLIDGFPRNEDNKNGWEQEMSDKTTLKQVFVITCPDEVCIERCLHRGTGRTDDNIQTLNKRLGQFKTEGQPVIDHYKGLNLVTEIDGSLPKEAVLTNVNEALTKISSQ